MHNCFCFPEIPWFPLRLFCYETIRHIHCSRFMLWMQYHTILGDVNIVQRAVIICVANVFLLIYCLYFISHSVYNMENKTMRLPRPPNFNAHENFVLLGLPTSTNKNTEGVKLKKDNTWEKISKIWVWNVSCGVLPISYIVNWGKLYHLKNKHLNCDIRCIEHIF